MIVNTQMRREQAEARLGWRQSAQVLTNLIVAGTNCSRFEAAVIAEKVEEVYELGEAVDGRPLQPGQMVWQAIAAIEPPGKPLRDCAFKRIVLTVHRLAEDREVLRRHGTAARRQQQIVRLTQEALEQGTLLTMEELGELLDSDERTIRRDVKALQERLRIVVPTRGNYCDIGPGITHREKVVELYLQGMEPLAIGRQLHHSLKSVERYIHSFARVIHAHGQLGGDVYKTALVVGVSVYLAKRCLQLHEQFAHRPELHGRLADIARIGTAYWQAQDGKKKLGRDNGGSRP